MMDEFWIHLKADNFVFCESSNDKKFSIHIAITGFSVENAKEANGSVNKSANECRMMKSFPPLSTSISLSTDPSRVYASLAF
jgi:hypothetical protein